ncbi:hypothetical protein ACU4GD_24970 [Cupriavidus basilensis]
MMGGCVCAGWAARHLERAGVSLYTLAGAGMSGFIAIQCLGSSPACRRAAGAAQRRWPTAYSDRAVSSPTPCWRAAFPMR